MADYVVAAVVDSAERNYQERIRLESLRDNSNPFHMAEEKFKKIFRLPRSGALHLVDSLQNPRLDEGYLPKHLKILAALNMFAQGSYQAAVGQDNFLGLSQPTVSRCLALTTEEIISTLAPQYLRFPMTRQERETAKTNFQDLYNMPNTIGAIDGTHVAIAKPPLNHPTAPGNLFYNRKGYYSVNCQIICSARGKIIALNPNFPGSTHDAAIWRASNIKELLLNEFVYGERNQWLLGDKGYPLQPWLMTPIMAPRNQAEANYNECHTRARNVVELCNGHLKNKFRCLHRHRCLHYQPEKAAQIIVACCTLYNMFLETFDDEQDINIIEDNEQEESVVEPGTDYLAEARQIRQTLINYFN